MKTGEILKVEMDKLMLFCQHNIEASSRLLRIMELVKDLEEK